MPLYLPNLWASLGIKHEEQLHDRGNVGLGMNSEHAYYSYQWLCMNALVISHILSFLPPAHVI